MNSLRKWLLKPKRSDQSLLAKFYCADEELNAVASELDSFDGRKDTSRCNNLVMKLRNHQDSVLTIIEQIMREVIPNSRARRDYRIKFPEEVLQESLAGQLWFGAECLAAGSSIVNKEIESLTMRPVAKSFTKQLDELRSLLREQCFKNLYSYIPQIKDALVNFDQLFADFELSYVSAMVPVKSIRDYDLLQDITVLFCETVSRAMKLGLLNQDQFDSYDPVLMFTIPRLAIVCGLQIYPDGPLNPDQDPCRVCEMFRQQLTLLFKIRELLATLHPQELMSLETLICNPSGSQSFSGSSVEVDSLMQNRSDVSENEHDEVVEETTSRCREFKRGASVGRPRTPSTLQSISWKGSNEFNFRLPRNTSRDDSSSIENVPCSLGNVEEVLDHQSATDVTSDNGVTCINTTRVFKGRDGYHARQVRRILQTNGAIPAQSQLLSNGEDDGSEGTRQQKRKSTGDSKPQGQGSLPFQEANHTQDIQDAHNPQQIIVSDTESEVDQKLTDLLNRSPCSHDVGSLDTLEDLSVLSDPSGDDEVESYPCCKSGSASSDSLVYLEVEHDEISRMIQLAKEAAGFEARSKFRSSSDLVHQLFVCISKVADQLQTNFASDFRHILKATFECQSSNTRASEGPVHSVREYPTTPLRIAGDADGFLSIENEVDHMAVDALLACGEPLCPPAWLPDDACSTCMSCKVPFTFVRRRHHCRNCGKIFCSQCSSNNVPLPHIGLSKPVRVCNACYIFHIIPFTNAS